VIARNLRWIVAGFAVAAALWLLDAAIRAFALLEGTFWHLVFTPPLGVVLTRLPLLALGIVLLLSMRGIAKLEAARREAVEERARLHELYDYTTDAIVTLDRDLRIVFMNKAAERIGGTRLSEAVGWPCYKAILGLDQPCKGCRVHEVFENAAPCSATKFEVTATGQENWLEQSWYPVRGPGGAVTAVIEVARDVSDEKLIERELTACHREVDTLRRAASAKETAAGPDE
jgi:PAS domain S-box-containing protein